MLNLISDVFVVLVAIEALFIMALEMFGSQTRVAQKAFNASASYLAIPETKASMANQGLYNGFIGVGILAGRFLFPANSVYPVLLLFVGFVVVAAIFGAMTVSKRILLTQGAPAIISLILLLLTH
ncbi:hypothetical protein LASUN_07500 [Lentilactobacillus sunkii]|jgi:putative membrane protein|uniref:DUF1304 domain-containing protein n=2 Tax=Lentilactobacillus sunkii TaxID=481719 RepID=A0A1E7XGP7_9LACO|nr:DUF1304 domain-containing protein [Lentilactobacillus sunkii]OFA12198.1 hypothetical protein LASUN_07500 [Lentilactobacillus sunkii]